MIARGRILVAGTAGGVGTTTVAALVVNRLAGGPEGPPRVLDHTAGDLGLRLAAGDAAETTDDRLVHDLGAHAFSLGGPALGDPRVVLVLVSAATGVGCELAAAGLTAVRDAGGPAALGRTVLVLSGALGRHRITHQAAGLATRGARAVVLLPADLALAAGGRLPLARLRGVTRRAVDQLQAAVTGAGGARPDLGAVLPPSGRAGGAATTS